MSQGTLFAPRSSDVPTLHVTNWNSTRLHGSGRKLSIMARPRPWEHGDGRVVDLTPVADDLMAFQQGQIDRDEYRRRYLASSRPAGPGSVVGDHGLRTDGGTFVRDGDTLLCGCSRSDAAEGRCHRSWAAEALAHVGWRVILDGVEVR